MKRFSWCALFVCLLFRADISEGGAAVAAQRQKAATKGQLQKERQLLQRRVQSEVQSKVQSAVAQQRVNANLTVDARPTSHVSVEDFWQALQASSKPWKQIVKPEDKAMVVSHYIDAYRKRGTKIRKPPEHYAMFIDQVIKENPSLLSFPFDRVLESVAIMEYDFDNGSDKDLLAKRVLGNDGFKLNKERLRAQKEKQQ